MISITTSNYGGVKYQLEDSNLSFYMHSVSNYRETERSAEFRNVSKHLGGR